MERLRVTGLTYLGGHPRHPRLIEGLRLDVALAGLSVGRPLRGLISVSWPSLTWLYVLTVGDVEGKAHSWEFLNFPNLNRAWEAGDAASVIGLGIDDATCWLLAPQTPVRELRTRLASWTLSAAGAQRKPGTGDADTPEQVALQAIAGWRAADLGRDPLTDRKTLSYRLAVAEQHRCGGDLLSALTLLQQLATQAVETFGATDQATIVTRNNLAFALAAGGFRHEAIEAYWEILDDLAAARIVDQTKAEMFARQNLARLHDPHWHP
ncbi:hypothetical protein [Streptomyces sp. Isolate_45]|uniref:hypothetical protein n=1 Tax=Streptomyces sp. Isolate_45 TaxID=2950111 RepID=UPI002481AA15|nr:hypothetical protein [Streptomyces sp. Isolate_45]MDA5286323.1 hypothetical protein [Streptomyces sp. Isolate_45]